MRDVCEIRSEFWGVAGMKKLAARFGRIGFHEAKPGAQVGEMDAIGAGVVWVWCNSHLNRGAIYGSLFENQFESCLQAMVGAATDWMGVAAIECIREEAEGAGECEQKGEQLRSGRNGAGRISIGDEP